MAFKTQPDIKTPTSRRFRARMLSCTLGGILLAACTSATPPLWYNAIADTNENHSSAGVIGSDGEIYHAYKEGRDIWLRKLASDGSEQWRETIGPGTDDYLSGQLIPADTGGVIAMYGEYANREASGINADGGIRWKREVTPQPISAWSRFNQDRFFLAYSWGYTQTGSDPLNEGVIALDDQGNEIWSHQFNENEGALTFYYNYSMATLDSGELMVAFTTRTDDLGAYKYQGHLYVFDKQGNVIKQREAAKFARLIDNNHSVFLRELGNISKLDASGTPVWTKEMFASPDAPYDYYFPPTLVCAGDGEQTIACGHNEDGQTVVWLSAEGAVLSQIKLTDISADRIYLNGLKYNGNHKWTVQREIVQNKIPAPLKISTDEVHTNFTVLSDQGIALQKIDLKPFLDSTFHCFFDPQQICEGTSGNGDMVHNTLAKPNEIIAVGVTATATSQAFVSAYGIK